MSNNQEILAHFDDSASDLVFWAFRYFLGRRTIATCSFARSLAKAWPSLDDLAQRAIRRELEQEFHDDDRARKAGYEHLPLGDDCDREAWELVRQAWGN